MLTEEEKKVLKNRIDTSIRDYRNKRKKQRFTFYVGIAAMVAICFSVVYIKMCQSTSVLEEYVTNTTIDIGTEEDVKLVMDDNEIKIKDKESNIIYSKSGEKVQINNDQKVNQSSKSAFNTIVVPYGKRTKITLSDGTKVWLNSGSKLTYPVAFTKNKREVHLTGEAIFDVTHNKQQPFYVITHNYDIKVLGTVFNVCSYEDDSYTSTALQQGSVEIKYDGNSVFGKSSLKISPGTLAVYNNKVKDINSYQVDVSKYMSWRDGKFIFRKQKMDVILKKLSRYYNVVIDIQNEDLKKQTFSGHLDLKDTIEMVMEVLRQSADLKYTIKDKRILIN